MTRSERLRRSETISELLYPELPSISDPDHWSRRMSLRVLELIWLGVDEFLRDFCWKKIDLSKDPEQIERDLTQMLERRIHRMMSGDEPFYVQHETYEFETRKTRSAKPPEYDLAFILRENERLIFPFEAKILPTDKNVSRYVNEITGSYLNCTYAPFSYEGGMLGYLLSGSAHTAFASIAKSLAVRLLSHPDLRHRDQRYSDHSRSVPKSKASQYPRNFRCHHTLLQLGPDS